MTDAIDSTHGRLLTGVAFRFAQAARLTPRACVHVLLHSSAPLSPSAWQARAATKGCVCVRTTQPILRMLSTSLRPCTPCCRSWSEDASPRADDAPVSPPSAAGSLLRQVSLGTTPVQQTFAYSGGGLAVSCSSSRADDALLTLVPSSTAARVLRAPPRRCLDH